MEPLDFFLKIGKKTFRFISDDTSYVSEKLVIYHGINHQTLFKYLSLKNKENNQIFNML